MRKNIRSKVTNIEFDPCSFKTTSKESLKCNYNNKYINCTYKYKTIFDDYIRAINAYHNYHIFKII